MSTLPNDANPNVPNIPCAIPLPTLPIEQTKPISEKLNTFLIHHLSFHRPIALVSSGGTITTLEQNTIRYLDNFSTGQRGAISVEEFCKRGYAVIHLWRKGSTAPYSRVLSKLLGCSQGNHGLDVNALGYLFEGQQQHQGSMVENDRHFVAAEKKENHDATDPWLSTTQRSKFYNDTSTTTATSASKQDSTSSHEDDKKYSSQNRMKLTTHILHNNRLQRKLRERADVISNNLLFTIPFTTIEEYIALLKISTEAMNQCQSLGLVYLAAAVSDFYIPEGEKCIHKIQSRNYDLRNKEQGNLENKRNDDGQRNTARGNAIVMNQSTNTLSLTLQPVPKVIHNLRQKWSPHAFCVSFKLETDETILEQKVKQAIENYDVHLVIGNVLDTRYDKVTLFERENDHNKSMNLKATEVTRSDSKKDYDDDELEDNIISHVVEKHFEYIANHYLFEPHNDIGDIDDNEYGDIESIDDGEKKNVLPRTALMTGAEAAARHNAIMRKKKEILQKELYWKRLRDVSLNIVGHAMGCYLSFALSSVLQNHLRGKY